MNIIFRILIFASSFFAVAAHAQWTTIKSKEFLLAPYPAPNSAAGKQDVSAVLAAQKTRTKDDCATGNRQRFADFRLLYAGFPKVITKQEIAAIEPFMKKVANFGDRVAGYHKDKFKRSRPYSVDANITPCVPKLSSDRSYPSSHTVVAYLAAFVLQDVLCCDREEILEKHAQYVANLRVKIGVHHPTDIKAGEKLADDIYTRIEQEADFQEDLAQARAQVGDLR